MSRELWDFNEDKNYILKHGYKVIKRKDSESAALLLKTLDLMIKILFTVLPKNINTDLLINTPYKLQEMQLYKDQGLYLFEGLNKPKNVKLTIMPNIGKDGRLRAKSRLIFLNLRNSHGKLKNIKKILPLLAHELAHTSMNHVTWRDNNHDAKFKEHETLLLRYLLRLCTLCLPGGSRI